MSYKTVYKTITQRLETDLHMNRADAESIVASAERSVKNPDRKSPVTKQEYDLISDMWLRAVGPHGRDILPCGSDITYTKGARKVIGEFLRRYGEFGHWEAPAVLPSRADIPSFRPGVYDS